VKSKLFKYYNIFPFNKNPDGNCNFFVFKPLAEDLMQDGRTYEPPRCGVSLARFPAGKDCSCRAKRIFADFSKGYVNG